MKPVSRRIFLYWLLLLVPALAVGGTALWLLRREQARLDERTRAATETRRAAIEARTRLIAENVELLVGDVENALMTTLREVPVDAPDTFFDNWERSNPLVRDTFRTDRARRMVRPAVDTAHAWLGRWLASGAPWRGTSRTDSEMAGASRPATVSNYSQMQRARNEIQETAKLKGSPAPATGRSGWQPWREGNVVHLVGWRLLSDGSVVGVEVDLSAIAARLGDVLPATVEPAESYALREVGGWVLQGKGTPADRSAFARSALSVQPMITVPISAEVLPGWEVVGFFEESYERSLAGGGFFALSALLIGMFVAAILAGGALLLRQARLSEAEAAQKTSFVANVSHEFKTPLTTIRLYSELLAGGRVRDDAQRGEYLEAIGRETQRLARLVNNVLDFSRLEQGRKKFAREEIDLAADVARLLDTHAPRLAEAGLELRRELPAEPLPVTADRDALEQIVLNLLENACKYAAVGGELTVKLAQTASGAELRVADRGPGVEAGQAERIFEKFHRVDDTLTAEKGGAGLGLSIARQLARGMKGELRYAARPGGGAEFILTFP